MLPAQFCIGSVPGRGAKDNLYDVGDNSPLQSIRESIASLFDANTALYRLLTSLRAFMREVREDGQYQQLVQLGAFERLTNQGRHRRLRRIPSVEDSIQTWLSSIRDLLPDVPKTVTGCVGPEYSLTCLKMISVFDVISRCGLKSSYGDLSPNSCLGRISMTRSSCPFYAVGMTMEVFFLYFPRSPKAIHLQETGSCSRQEYCRHVYSGLWK